MAQPLISSLEKLIGTPRDGALLRTSLGSEYLKAGEEARAIEQLREAVRRDPDYSAAWKLLGQSARRTPTSGAGARSLDTRHRGGAPQRRSPGRKGNDRVRAAPVAQRREMNFYQSLRQFVIGEPLDPLSTRTRHNLALVAFFAWVGLGADGISSSCYGPEEAFKALGEHTHLGLYLAFATVGTVFLIALAYNQVIELFPTGGGGYRVASRLVGPYAGVVSGAALLVDYVLTIAISVAAGVDALFSLLPVAFQTWKLVTSLVLVVALVLLNLRGMKEAIRVLLPVFLGFVFTHVILILYGVLSHCERIRRARAGDAGRRRCRALQLWDGRRSPRCCSSRTRRAAVLTRGWRPSPTTSTCSPSRAYTPASSPCSTWPHRLRSPRAASCSSTCYGTRGRSKDRR
jgi:hypothetical protein